MTAEPVWRIPGRSRPVPDPAPSFDALYREHYARLHRFLLGMTRRDPVAEDIAQETLLRAFLHWDDLDPDRSPWPWLKKVATRLVYDHARAQRPVGDAAVADQPIADASAAFADRQLVSQMLDGLPERQRAAVTLRYLDDWKSAEIAAVLGLPRPAVEQLLLRARRSLKVEYRRLSGDRLRLALWPLLAWSLRLRARAARSVKAIGEAFPTVATTGESVSALVVAGALAVSGAAFGTPSGPSTSPSVSAGAGRAENAIQTTHSPEQPPRPRKAATNRVSAESQVDTRTATHRPSRQRVGLAVESDRMTNAPASAQASTGRDGDTVRTRGTVEGGGGRTAAGINIPCDSGSVMSAATCDVHDAVVETVPELPDS